MKKIDELKKLLEVCAEDSSRKEWVRSRRNYEYRNFSEGKSNWNEDLGNGTFVIPDGVTEIGEWEFKDRTTLERVTIPESVTKIGKGAFSFTHKNKKHVSESVHFSQKTLMSFVTSKYWEPVDKHKTLVFEVRLTVGEMNKTGLDLIYVNVSFNGDNSIDKIVIECQTDNGKKTINVQKGTREFAEIEDLAFEYGKKEN